MSSVLRSPAPSPLASALLASAALAAIVALAGCGGPEDSGAGNTVPGGVTVVSVTDGDTVDVERDGVDDTVRIIGINAPERGECLADAATERLVDQVDGQVVTLVVDETDRDRFGRLLRYVEIDGIDVGEDLVRSGLALARRYPPDTARADRLDAAQAEAEADGVGMWADDACGPVATDAGAVGFGDLRFDADGNDNENLNDEWVEIVNRGDVDVDLSGWVVKDESATHRYRFDDVVLGAGASITLRTGCGADTATDLHWCVSGSAVWNNSGDTAFLLDPAGNIVESRRGP